MAVTIVSKELKRLLNLPTTELLGEYQDARNRFNEYLRRRGIETPPTLVIGEIELPKGCDPERSTLVDEFTRETIEAIDDNTQYVYGIISQFIKLFEEIDDSKIFDNMKLIVKDGSEITGAKLREKLSLGAMARNDQICVKSTDLRLLLPEMAKHAKKIADQIQNTGKISKLKPSEEVSQAEIEQVVSSAQQKKTPIRKSAVLANVPSSKNLGKPVLKLTCDISQNELDSLFPKTAPQPVLSAEQAEVDSIVSSGKQQPEPAAEPKKEEPPASEKPKDTVQKKKTSKKIPNGKKEPLPLIGVPVQAIDTNAAGTKMELAISEQQYKEVMSGKFNRENLKKFSEEELRDLRNSEPEDVPNGEKQEESSETRAPRPEKPAVPVDKKLEKLPEATAISTEKKENVEKIPSAKPAAPESGAPGDTTKLSKEEFNENHSEKSRESILDDKSMNPGDTYKLTKTEIEEATGEKTPIVEPVIPGVQQPPVKEYVEHPAKTESSLFQSSVLNILIDEKTKEVKIEPASSTAEPEKIPESKPAAETQTVVTRKPLDIAPIQVPSKTATSGLEDPILAAPEPKEKENADGLFSKLKHFLFGKKNRITSESPIDPATETSVDLTILPLSGEKGNDTTENSLPPQEEKSEPAHQPVVAEEVPEKDEKLSDGFDKIFEEMEEEGALFKQEDTPLESSAPAIVKEEKTEEPVSESKADAGEDGADEEPSSRKKRSRSRGKKNKRKK